MDRATFIRAILPAFLGFKQPGLLAEQRALTTHVMTHESPGHLTTDNGRGALEHSQGSDGGGTNSRTRVVLLSVPRWNLRDTLPQFSLRGGFGPWMAAQGTLPGTLRGGGLRKVCARNCSRRPQGLECFSFF